MHEKHRRGTKKKKEKKKRKSGLLKKGRPTTLHLVYVYTCVHGDSDVQQSSRGVANGNT